MTDKNFLIKTAPLFDVHKWSDYPEVDNAINGIFDEIKRLRSSKRIRIRGAQEVKKHLKVVIIDLWAARLGINPYRAISKNKTSYQQESRYQKIFLKYDYLIPILDDLTELGYIEQRLGYFDRSTGRGKSTRIKATDSLLDKICRPEYGVNDLIISKGYLAIVGNTSNKETVILRDSDGTNIEYEDTEETNRMRDNLITINEKLNRSRVVLEITDEQLQELVNRVQAAQDPERREINFTNVNLVRIFNNGSFSKGGRFYGGWWQNLPKEYRKYITINYKPTVEIDYSGHHIRILYAQEGIEPPEDPYDLDEEHYSREDQKEAMLIMLNAANKAKALAAMRKKGISNTNSLVAALEDRHESIQQYFFTGIGLDLMYKDSMLAEAVMLRMIQERGAAVLPVHDSFIVRNSYDRELEEIMKEEFKSMFGANAEIKLKKTALEEESERRTAEIETIGFVTDDLEELLQETNTNYSNVRKIWGS